MSHSTLLSLIQLPVELMYRILCYLDIPDILRIRRVSRYLNGVSHCREVWSNTYRKAKFIHPPGPIPSQSAHDLENVLVSSFRVDRNLRLGGERPTVKLGEIQYTDADVGASLVFGRFLLIAFSTEIHCYDLNLEFNSKSDGNIIHRSTGGTLRSFHCVSAINIEGHLFACVVLSETMGIMETAVQISIYLLNVGEKSEVTLDLLHQFEQSEFNNPTVHLGPRVIVVQGVTGYDFEAEWCIAALDVHTRTQFSGLCPSFTNAAWEAAEIPELDDMGRIALPTSISTSTHLLLARSFYTGAAVGWSTFLQAFALPPPHTYHCSAPTLTTLIPSHSDIIPSISLGDAVLLHDAVIDSSTQDVLIAIRAHVHEPSYPWSGISKHGVLRLSTPTSHDKVGTITFQPLGSLGQHPLKSSLRFSFDGTGRAFYLFETFNIFEQSPCQKYIVSALEYDLHAKRGDNDDGEHEAKVVEYPCILQFPITPHRMLLDYDPYSGRICFQCFQSTMCVRAHTRVIEIFDLAV